MSEMTENRAGGVFVIEDDEQIARMLGDLLEDEGYRVRLGNNGNVLTMALAAPPELFLLDVMMPGIDGIEFCRRLRDYPATAHTPVIFITAAPTDILAHRLSTITYEGLINKPFALDDILRVVRRYVNPS
jgi:CheY-like chemotaxis protein